ncbi:hypothetical protein E5288_WYG018008 [Bos mutus]|uniref:Uncharacterized protein n=1 Tax=Bos mutus TaxID=72004 RepID=A0A6B0RYT0_9CETA|nr:hypothetical protein [Bos mutus]
MRRLFEKDDSSHRFGHVVPSTHILLSTIYLLVPPAVKPIVYGVKNKVGFNEDQIFPMDRDEIVVDTLTTDFGGETYDSLSSLTLFSIKHFKNI